ncbi:hypothetical protein HYY71_05900 [Candidatus Woesearchaeota archaeon]|nr:hypothetical protein [Candidatus Woesearchaeota archaeon]
MPESLDKLVAANISDVLNLNSFIRGWHYISGIIEGMERYLLEKGFFDNDDIGERLAPISQLIPILPYFRENRDPIGMNGKFFGYRLMETATSEIFDASRQYLMTDGLKERITVVYGNMVNLMRGLLLERGRREFGHIPPENGKHPTSHEYTQFRVPLILN